MISVNVFWFAGVPKGAMLTHGNLVADSAGMIRVSYVSPGVVRTAFGEEEQTPGHQSLAFVFRSHGTSNVTTQKMLFAHQYFECQDCMYCTSRQIVHVLAVASSHAYEGSATCTVSALIYGPSPLHVQNACASAQIKHAV